MSVRVGVVDSGFRENQQDWIADSAAFVLEGSELWLSEAEYDQIEHGSRIIDIIQHHCPASEFYSAQVFDQRGRTSASQVAAAVEWLCDHDVQVINLSLGVRQDREVLARAIKRALGQGVVICASSPARGEPVYPAAYPGVFRMTGDARCALGEFSWQPSPYADLGGHVLGLDQIKEKAGASLACAHLTAEVVQVVEQWPEIDRAGLVSALKERSSYQGPELRFPGAKKPATASTPGQADGSEQS